MGYIKHHAIVVTTYSKPRAQKAADEASRLGCTVVGPSEELTNGYSSFMVCPDGSKEGWETSAKGDDAREAFKGWLRKQAYEWVEIAFGGDFGRAEIADTSGVPHD